MIPRRQAINVPASICCILHANRDMGEVPSESARSPAVTCPDSEACSTTRLSARVACHERCRGRAIKRGAFAALSANTDRLLCLAAILPFELCLGSSCSHHPDINTSPSTSPPSSSTSAIDLCSCFLSHLDCCTNPHTLHASHAL
jgi:hypothetical protein